MSESTDRRFETRDRVRGLLESGALNELRGLLEGFHPSDVAELLEDLEQAQRVVFLELLPAEVAADVLAEVDEAEHPAELLALLDPDRIGKIVQDLADDDAADLIGELDPAEQARILAQVSQSEASDIERLLHYAEDTAGGIMTREIVAISADLTTGEAIEAVRSQASEAGDFYTIFVVDAHNFLSGVVSLQSLVIGDPGAPVSELLEEAPAVVHVDMDQEDVSRTLSKYNLAAIGVVDSSGRLVGRVTFDDVIDVLEAETTEDILRFAAVSEEEELRGSTGDAIRSRLPWLLTSLVTAALAASVVVAFEATIQQFIILAAAIPVIAGVGGNAGTQALAVTIRRIALSNETLSERMQVVSKELAVGMVNGLVVGVVAALLGFLLPEVPGFRFGLVVLFAMWGSLLIASFLGAFIPIMLESMDVDPAVASSPFVTTLTDVIGLLLLLGLASVMLV